MQIMRRCQQECRTLAGQRQGHRPAHNFDAHADALEDVGSRFARARRLQAAYSLPHVEKHLLRIDVQRQHDHEARQAMATSRNPHQVGGPHSAQNASVGAIGQVAEPPDGRWP